MNRRVLMLMAVAFLNACVEPAAQVNRTPEWAWQARMAAIALSLSEKPSELEALANDLARDGYNVATVHPGPLCYDILDYDNPQHFSALKALVDVFHARGIRVVIKSMSLWQNKRQFPQYERTAGWSARGHRTSYHLPPRPGSRAWYSCFNNTLIRDAHLKKLPKLLAATGIDGFMTDALIRPDLYACVCEHCRRKFKGDTGFDAPSSMGSPFWDNPEDPGYRAWLLWRVKSVTDFLADLNRAMQRLDPPRFLLEYYAPGIPSMLTSATDIEVLADAGACMIGQEIGVAPASPYNWRYILAKLRHVQSLSLRRCRVPFAIFHNTHAQSCPHFFRALAWSLGLRKWEYPKPYGAVRGVLVSKSALHWDKRHQDLLTRVQSPATIAIVYSRRSYVLVKGATRQGQGRKDSGDKEYFGWAELLIEKNIPYHSLVDRDLDADTLSQYSIVILPNVACLSVAAAKGIQDFVAKGGRLIAVAETSLYSEDGEKQGDFQLGELLGVRYRGFIRGASTLKLGPGIRRGLPAGLDSCEVGGLSCAKVAILPRAKQVASIHSSNDVSPGIVSSRFGNGHVVYFATNPGQEVFHNVSFLGSRGGKWEAPKGELYEAIMEWALGERMDASFRCVAVPKGVVVSLLRQRDGERDRMLLHLLNLRLTEAEPDGGEIAKRCEVVYPYVPGPLVVDVKAPWPCRAYVISPDFDGHRNLAVTKAKDYCRLAVPELIRYSLVCIEAAENHVPPARQARTPVEHDYRTTATITIIRPCQSQGTVNRPIGSRNFQAHQYVVPAKAKVRVDSAVQVDVPINVEDPVGLELHYWEADLSDDDTSGRGRFVKLLLVNGKEMTRHEMFGDGSWVERRCDLSRSLTPKRPNVLSLRLEAVTNGETERPVHVWWTNLELWRNGESLTTLAWPPADGARH